MLDSIQFQNFKALRDATLPLGPFTLLVGPNGSGKEDGSPGAPTRCPWPNSAYSPSPVDWDQRATNGPHHVAGGFDQADYLQRQFTSRAGTTPLLLPKPKTNSTLSCTRLASTRLIPTRWPNLCDLSRIPNGRNGSGSLAVVLDQLRDRDPERFEHLNKDLHNWLPEFDRVLFETPKGKDTVSSCFESAGRRTKFPRPSYRTAPCSLWRS